MTRKILGLILAALLPVAAFGQTNAQQNEAGTTYLPSDGQISSNFAVDRALRTLVSVASGTNGPLSVIPVSTATKLNGVASGLVGWGLVGSDLAETGTTTTVINATAHSAKVGDIIWVNGGSAARQWSPVSAIAANTITVSNAFTVAPANGDQFFIQRPIPIASTNNTNLSGQSLAAFLDANYQQSAATGILKLEDSAATSGDAGIQIFGISDLSNAVGNFTSADGDYVPWKLTRGGVGNVQLNTLYTASAEKPTSLLKNEDDATASGDAGVAIFGKLQSAISADAASDDYGLIKGDTGGRLITTIAPAGETWYSCTSPITGTGHTQIKAAVASNRIYITHFTCSNTGTVSSNLYIEDNTTPIYVGGVASATIAGIGNWSAVFPVPIRLSVNSALQVAMVTTGTATTCCASGYISTI